jgi:hypothetical protein
VSNRTDSTAVTAEQVEEHLRGAIAEASANVEACANETPENLAANAEVAASAANVATVWTNVTVGLVAGLERFRLAHDKVKGAGTVKPPGGLDAESDLRQLLGRIKTEAENGASPMKIAQLVAESGLFAVEG